MTEIEKQNIIGKAFGANGMMPAPVKINHMAKIAQEKYLVLKNNRQRGYQEYEITKRLHLSS